jgi:lipopolysaccharide export system permease protein
MKTLHLMLIRSFLTIFIFSLLFFIMIIQLLDIFSNLWRYLAHEATMGAMLRIAWFYIPKCISYALPVSLLFTVSFTLGTLYKNNELIAILGSGVSLYRLLIPFLVLGLALSVGSFFFEQLLVIDSFRHKNEVFREVVHQAVSRSNTNVTVLSGDARTIYHTEYYNDNKQTITKAIILIQDSEGELETRLDADWGEWTGTNWTLHNCRLYHWDADSGVFDSTRLSSYDAPELTEPPATFYRPTQNVEEMGYREAYRWVQQLRKAGLPHREALTEYYSKYFFAFSAFIVILIASGVGGRFKKNVLLMNLLTSLVLSVLYYVIQMIALILAKSGYIPPLAGASAALLIFLAGGVYLLRIART